MRGVASPPMEYWDTCGSYLWYLGGDGMGTDLLLVQRSWVKGHIAMIISMTDENVLQHTYM